MSIKEFIEKSKHFPYHNKDVSISIIIILVAFGGFGLGRLSKAEELKEPIRIEEMSASVAGIVTNKITPQTKKISPLQGGGVYVASKTGKKYHFPWCSGAKRINEANKVIFNTPEEARDAGYTPAKNCKGLQ